jgi:precorrin-3B C17-methyltransferase
MTGRLFIVGLGPSDERFWTHEAQEALMLAQDIIGYTPYLERLTLRDDQIKHPSDNRVELARAQDGLVKAASGRVVAIVSGGDPGIFAMSAAVFEAIEFGNPDWRNIDITVIPGISAMQAAAARLGAPLGHDFCVISLSDNLKPWRLIEQRLEYAARGDFVIALYNPASKARPNRIEDAFSLLRNILPSDTHVVLAKSIGRKNEELILTNLSSVDGSRVDMTTLVIIGSRATRRLSRGAKEDWLYTPRGSK